MGHSTSWILFNRSVSRTRVSTSRVTSRTFKLYGAEMWRLVALVASSPFIMSHRPICSQKLASRRVSFIVPASSRIVGVGVCARSRVLRACACFSPTISRAFPVGRFARYTACFPAVACEHRRDAPVRANGRCGRPCPETPVNHSASLSLFKAGFRTRRPRSANRTAT